MAQSPTHMQIDNMEHYAECVRHAQTFGGEAAFAFAFGRFVNWFALGVPANRGPGILRYRITIVPDISMPYSFHGALLCDKERTIRGETEMIRNGGLVYDKWEKTWGVHT